MRSFLAVYLDRGDINFPQCLAQQLWTRQKRRSSRAVITSKGLSRIFTSVPSAIVIAKRRLVDDRAQYPRCGSDDFRESFESFNMVLIIIAKVTSAILNSCSINTCIYTLRYARLDQRLLKLIGFVDDLKCPSNGEKNTVLNRRGREIFMRVQKKKKKHVVNSKKKKK